MNIETEIAERLARMEFPTLGGISESEYAEMLRNEYRREEMDDELHEMLFRSFIRKQYGVSSDRMLTSNA